MGEMSSAPRAGAGLEGCPSPRGQRVGHAGRCWCRQVHETLCICKEVPGPRSGGLAMCCRLRGADPAGCRVPVVPRTPQELSRPAQPCPHTARTLPAPCPPQPHSPRRGCPGGRRAPHRVPLDLPWELSRTVLLAQINPARQSVCQTINILPQHQLRGALHLPPPKPKPTPEGSRQPRTGVGQGRVPAGAGAAAPQAPLFFQKPRLRWEELSDLVCSWAEMSPPLTPSKHQQAPCVTGPMHAGFFKKP